MIFAPPDDSFYPILILLELINSLIMKKEIGNQSNILSALPRETCTYNKAFAKSVSLGPRKLRLRLKAWLSRLNPLT